jgi:Uma2 family endonuclease
MASKGRFAMSQTAINGRVYVPPLENGDRLSREEFERRYDAMPHVKKAELIEGVVYMGSPVRYGHHGRPHNDLGAYLAIYRHFTPGTGGGDNFTVRLDEYNEPQPDVGLFIVGGNARIDEDDYISGSPELVAEVSSSTVSIDLGAKPSVYKRNGVKEYVVWRIEDKEIDWFVLRGGQYERLAPEVGIFKSETFPGLWIDCDALLRGDYARVHEVLQQGLQSPEHAAFVAQLTSRAS